MRSNRFNVGKCKLVFTDAEDFVNSKKPQVLILRDCGKLGLQGGIAIEILDTVFINY